MNKVSYSSNRCPTCSSSDYYLDSRASQILGLQASYKVLTCSGCNLKRLDPQLSNMELENIYSQGYFDSTNADKPTIEDIELPANYEDAVKSRYAKFNQTVLNLKVQFPQAKRFLDVGAATGDMVAIARDSGLYADGIEFSDFAVKQAKDKFGLDLKQCSLAEIEAKSYDLIHLNHVFEHFNDPVGELTHLHRILRAGGGMYIEIPYQFHVVERLKHRLKPRKVYQWQMRIR